MKLTNCFVDGLEPWGMFAGVLLSRSKEENLNKCKSSVDFYNKTSKELEDFFEIYTYSVENLEKWFRR